ncbi:hypothetical protein H6G83_04660 [Anabaena azotica FACHB-119]|uniref:Uncharacterized protein n=1 Tax=Anabaena azotica FACHB-119 TaxID=947527 RepID=A0ABR8CZ30_9NOST|nr:hypothetical protein [Anabaena azotica FACHB-119]
MDNTNIAACGLCTFVIPPLSIIRNSWGLCSRVFSGDRLRRAGTPSHS